MTTTKEPITITHPQLLKEWDYTKNSELDPTILTAGMGKRIWWKCSKGHEWDTYLYSRTKSKSGCPQCHKERFRQMQQNKPVDYKKSLAYLRPSVAKEWHAEKNGERGPDTYGASSNRVMWWKCSKGHEWTAAICHRKKPGCPYCLGYRLTKENSFGGKHPHLVFEWHPTKNGEITAYDVFPHTHKKAWFICQKGHEWKAFISNRSKGKGCPHCSGHKPTKQTSLLAVHPHVCEEWHPTKNGDRTPDQFKPQSNEKVWWKCKFGHEWENMIYLRVNGALCPSCHARNKTSFPEQAIFFYLKQLFSDAVNRVNLPFLDMNMEADIYIPSLHLAVEYDGYYHAENSERDERKNLLMKNNDVQLLRIRQMTKRLTLPELTLHGSIEFIHEYDKKTGLDECITQLLSWLSKRYHKDVSAISVKTQKHRGDILQQLADSERNLETLFPELVEEWDREQNGSLLPSQVAPFTHTTVWWKCRKNSLHVWESKISNRANGRTCPYCLNRKINETNSLFALSPLMRKQWHPTKNKGISPHNISLNYAKKVWWICEHGHEWERSPNSRVSKKGYKCPECRKLGIAVDINEEDFIIKME